MMQLLSCVLQHTATHCNTLQHAATRNGKQHEMMLLRRRCDAAALMCHGLAFIALQQSQDTATRCNALHHTAPHSTTLHQEMTPEK